MDWRLRATAISVAIAVLQTCSEARAGQFDCGKPPPLADEQLKVDLSGKAAALGKLGGAALSGAIRTSRSEVLSRYPHADQVIADAYYRYLVCSIVMNDAALTADQKLAKLKEAMRGFSTRVSPGKTSKSRREESLSAQTLTDPGAKPNVAATNGGIVNEGSIGQITQSVPTLSRREYLPKLQEFYARGEGLLARLQVRSMPDEQMYVLTSDFNGWFSEVKTWLGIHMTPSAAAEFDQWVPSPMLFSMDGDHAVLAQQDYQALYTVLPQKLDHLKYLMNSDAMDPQH